MRVLLAAGRDDLEPSLLEQGYEVQCVRHREGIMATTQRFEPSVVIVNPFLPGKDEVDALLYGIRLSKQSPRIILLVGSITADKLQKYMAYGIYDLIYNPVTLEKILERLRQPMVMPEAIALIRKHDSSVELFEKPTLELPDQQTDIEAVERTRVTDGPIQPDLESRTRIPERTTIVERFERVNDRMKELVTNLPEIPMPTFTLSKFKRPWIRPPGRNEQELGEIVVVTGPPYVGKTWFISTLLNHFSNEKRAVALDYENELAGLWQVGEGRDIVCVKGLSCIASGDYYARIDELRERFDVVIVEVTLEDVFAWVESGYKVIVLLDMNSIHLESVRQYLPKTGDITVIFNRLPASMTSELRNWLPFPTQHITNQYAPMQSFFQGWEPVLQFPSALNLHLRSWLFK